MERAETVRRIAALELEMRRDFALRSGRAVTQLDLSIAQLRLLFVLDGSTAVATHELAEALGVTPPTVTSSVDRLVRRGLVSRTEDPADRRRKRLSLTVAGQEALRSVDAEGMAGLMRAIERLDDTELADLHRLLSRLREVATPEG